MDRLAQLLAGLTVVAGAGVLQPEAELPSMGGMSMLPSTRRAGWVHIPKAGSTFLNTVAHWLDEHHWLPPSARQPSCNEKDTSTPDICSVKLHRKNVDVYLEETFNTMCEPA